jgi:Flp pilus assembly protein TadD
MKLSSRTAMQSTLLSVMLSAALSVTPGATAPAIAAGTDETPTAPRAVNDLEEGRSAVKARQWAKAITHLDKALARDRNNADIHNWLGFSHRNNGSHVKAMEHYNIALKLNPNHRGANEYIGIAYLIQRDKAKAEEHLAKLETICGKSCDEYKDLQKAIDTFTRTGTISASYGG